MTSPRIHVAEISAHNGAAVVTLYYAQRGFTTTPTDTPANTEMVERLLQPAFLRRMLFSTGTTYGESKIDYGDLVLNNKDGKLDFLANYGLDGRTIKIYSGVKGAAYPAGYVLEFQGTMEVPVFQAQTVTVKVRSNQFNLTQPYQPIKYLGTGVLEGGSDIVGKPKPRIFGSVLNVAPVLVHGPKLIFQVNDGPIANVTVYDKGLILKGGTWAATSALAAFTGGNIWGSIYAAGYYILVGYDTTNSDIRLVYSNNNGVTWTQAVVANHTLMQMRDITYDPSMGFMGVGTAGNVWFDNLIPSVWSSFASSTAQQLNGVVIGKGLFVAVGVTGAVTTSPDRTSWVNRTSNSGGNDLNGICFGNGLFVAVGGNGVICTSPDGITWTSQTSPFGATALRSVAYALTTAGPLYVAVGDGGVVGTSIDGVVWQKGTSGTGNNLLRITSNNGLFITVGASGTLLTSPDGKAWAAQTSNFGATSIFSIACSDTLTILGGASAKYTTNSVGVYASAADLLDDTLQPKPGEVKAWLAGGYFRLGLTPVGTPTCDVDEGATAADRTSAQVFKRILASAGYGAGTFSATDITALDVANSGIIGIARFDDTTYEEVLDAVAGTPGAWWGVDRTGIFRIQRVEDPSVGASTFTITQDTMFGPPNKIAVNDAGLGLPSFSTILNYAKNYNVLRGEDLSFIVPTARRNVLLNEWQTVKAADPTVQTKYLLAPETTEDTLFLNATDALAEATRRQTLRGVKRDRFDITMELNAVTAVIDLGNIGTVFHRTRFSLAAGRKMMVIGTQPDAAKRRIIFSVWG